MSAVKWLIVINRIQNKSFCLHNIYVCTLYIYYVYTNTNTYMSIFKKNMLCLYIKYRVNLPIKLTKIYIETFLVHKILVSLQKLC